MRATREGRRFYIASFLIAVAAVNTGNNLIYLILSLLLSIILLSFVILIVNLSRLTIDVSATGPVFSGEETRLCLSAVNNKKRLPSYSINVSELTSGSSAYYSFIAPQSRVSQDMKMTFRRRGVYSYGIFIVGSGFPFILMTNKKPVATFGEVIVYPEFRDITHILPENTGNEDGGIIGAIGPGEDIYSIRDYRHGDDLRKMHWKASAKTSNLLVKEFAEYETRKTTIMIDNFLSKNVHGRTDNETDEVFETVVSLAASLSRHYLDLGHFVRIVSCRKVIPFGRGDEQLYRILDILAVMRQEESWESSLPSDGDGLVISIAGKPGSPFISYASTSDMVVYADRL